MWDTPSQFVTYWKCVSNCKWRIKEMAQIWTRWTIYFANHLIYKMSVEDIATLLIPVKSYLERKTADKTLTVTDWSPQSPDLNIIETVTWIVITTLLKQQIEWCPKTFAQYCTWYKENVILIQDLWCLCRSSRVTINVEKDAGNILNLTNFIWDSVLDWSCLVQLDHQRGLPLFDQYFIGSNTPHMLNNA